MWAEKSRVGKVYPSRKEVDGYYATKYIYTLMLNQGDQLLKCYE